MCSKPSKILLCTCEKKMKIDDSTSYWKLLRYDPKLKLQIMGDPYMPEYFDSEKYKLSADHLINLLNFEQIFDTPIEFMEKDLLEIYIIKEDVEYLYFFQFLENKWTIPKFTPFDWINYFKTLKKGIVRSLN